jgi:hypothetical protein
MRAWNLARSAGGHPDAPLAESLHQRFNRGAKRKTTWRRLLEGACAGGASAAANGGAADTSGRRQARR